MAQLNTIDKNLFSTMMSGTERQQNRPAEAVVDYSKFKISIRRTTTFTTSEPECKKAKFDVVCVESNKKGSSSKLSNNGSTCGKDEKPKAPVQPAQSAQPSTLKRKIAATMQEDPLEMMLKSKNEQTKVYSGKKKEKNEEVRQPLQIIKPFNVAKNSDEEFLERIKKQFPEKADKPKKEGKTWEDVYKKLVAKKEKKEAKKEKEEAKKLAEITSRIGSAASRQETERKTMLIDVVHKAGRRGNNNAPKMVEAPKAADLSKARKAIGTGSRVKMEAPVAAAIQKTKADPKKKKQEPKVYAPMMKQCRRDFKYNPWH